MLLFLFGQYLQSNIQALVIKIFRRDIHLPSLANEWHIPLAFLEPTPPSSRELPLDEHDASYLAQPDNKDDRIVTLVTCTKGGKERYYVKARAK